MLALFLHLYVAPRCPSAHVLALSDTDGDGTLSVDEFFNFSLSNASTVTGTEALQTAFRKYDTDASGYLDALEFANACTELGFGSMAHAIFESLDRDQSGTVAYDELLASLTSSMPTDGPTRAMLTALAMSSSAEHNAAKRALDTKGWEIKGRDTPAVQAELQALLRNSGARVVDLVQLFDDDAGGGEGHFLIDDVEFSKTMRTTFRYRGPPFVLADIFRLLDRDGSGTIGFDELYEFIKGKRHSLDQRRKPPFDTQLRPAEGRALDELAWDTDVLRVLIADMLARCHKGAADLLKMWRARKGLRRLEWISRAHAAFFQAEDADLWQSEVCAVAHAAFDELLSMTRTANFLQKVGIVHFQRWLRLADRAGSSSSPTPAGGGAPAASPPGGDAPAGSAPAGGAPAASPPGGGAPAASPPGGDAPAGSAPATARPTVRLGPKLVGPPWEVICVPMEEKSAQHDKVVDRPGLHLTIDTLPLKTPAQLKEMRNRRQVRDASDGAGQIGQQPAAGGRPSSKRGELSASLLEVACAGIAKAAERTAAREASAREVSEGLTQRRLSPAVGSGLGVAWARPAEGLLRWEVPLQLELRRRRPWETLPSQLPTELSVLRSPLQMAIGNARRSPRRSGVSASKPPLSLSARSAGPSAGPSAIPPASFLVAPKTSRGGLTSPRSSLLEPLSEPFPEPFAQRPPGGLEPRPPPLQTLPDAAMRRPTTSVEGGGLGRWQAHRPSTNPGSSLSPRAATAPRSSMAMGPLTGLEPLGPMRPLTRPSKRGATPNATQPRTKPS